MPVYCYKCEKCETTKQAIRTFAKSKEPLACECGGNMVLQLSKTMPPSVMETVDKFRNVKWRKNQEQRIRARAKKHFIENEVGELIEKHGVEESKRFGWINKKGKKVKKDDLK